jgi:hypothetical protein
MIDFQPSKAWIEMSLEAIAFAKKKGFIADYKHFCSMQQPSGEKNYADRMRVLNYLINFDVIRINDKKLSIGTIKNSEWIELGLINGSSDIWKLATFINPESSVIKKFDSDRLAEIGLRGENFVLERLKYILPENQHKLITHVARFDDTLGYDIRCPFTKETGSIALLEIKTTVRPGNEFRLFLTRNEFRISQINKEWNLVLVKITDNSPSILGHIKGAQISDLMPKNLDKRVSWQTVEMMVDHSWVIPELP